MIKLENIFNLFSYEEDLEGIDEKLFKGDITNHPLYLIGMYNKLILNHYKFYNKTLKFFKETNQELDIEDIKNAGEFVLFNRAWIYIEKVSPTNDKEYIKKYSDKDLKSTLNVGMKYFEKNEQYEKCSHLKNIFDVL